jgi:hypothetical protein
VGDDYSEGDVVEFYFTVAEKNKHSSGRLQPHGGDDDRVATQGQDRRREYRQS